MVGLVDKLCQGEHPVEIKLGSEKTLDELKRCVDRGYVFIKFIDTEGGTELGVQFNRDTLDLGSALETPGTIRFVGGLTLDYVRVRCVALIDTATFAGHGHLERVDEG